MYLDYLSLDVLRILARLICKLNPTPTPNLPISKHSLKRIYNDIHNFVFFNFPRMHILLAKDNLIYR